MFKIYIYVLETKFKCTKGEHKYRFQETSKFQNCNLYTFIHNRGWNNFDMIEVETSLVMILMRHEQEKDIGI